MPADADRNLFFGLLAIQNAMITRDQLVAAFGAWTGTPGRTIADYLVDQGALTPSRRALLEALAEEHMAVHGGGPEATLAALEIGSTTRDTLARLVCAGVESSLARVGIGRGEDRGMKGLPNIPETAESVALGAGSATDTTLFPADIAANSDHRFRLIRPHARGGLGEVFVALDSELNREVAIKQILDRHADDLSCRQRFLVEAEITGGLEHPGIVPVYSLGIYHDGRPYYAMRFIKGDSLREAIARIRADESNKADPGHRSLELRKLLRRFTDVCNAIEYAHSRGVLHRDIKPANVIVGRYGETLVVDWGLAKPLGHTAPEAAAGERTLVPSSGSGSAETVPGSAVGTPAYMSPEQAEGDLHRVGTRSDVYSLGATRYCVLTGNAPFDGNGGEILQKVQRSEFLPPRQVDPSIDSDLEAICLKAMAANPEGRYRSCRALAEDLERWAADEPVTAYREPFARRARRWAKRNRSTVTGVGAALLAGVIGLSAVLVVQARANAELTRSRAAVQARYDLAVDAIKTFHTGVSGDFLLKQAEFKELRDRLLNSATNYYDKLGALLDNETDFASRRALAQANFDLADLTEQVGRREAALAAHRAVLARRQALVSDPAADAETKAEVGRSLTAVGHLLSSTGKSGEAEAFYREAQALLVDLTRTAPSPAAARSALAFCRSRLGSLLTKSDKRSDALAVFALARADQEARASLPGVADEARIELAHTIVEIAILLYSTDKPSEAEVEFRKALALYQDLAGENPSALQFQSMLAGIRNNIGIMLMQMGKPREAEAEYRKAILIEQKLADLNPAVTRFRAFLANHHNNLGNLFGKTGRPSEAEAEYRMAIAADQRLVDDNPAVPQFRNALASAYMNLGNALSQTGRPSEAGATFRRAVALDHKLANDHPEVPDYRGDLANSLTTLAKSLREAGTLDEARQACDRARALVEPLVKDHPQSTNYGSLLAATYLVSGQAHLDAGDAAAASTALRKATELYDGLESPDGGQMFCPSCCHAALAGLAGRPGSGVTAADGRDESDRAMSSLRQAVAFGFRAPYDYRYETALDPLRDRKDFRLLILDLVMPDDPFAHGG